MLVANNGLAAVKFMRSVRSWAYKTFDNERAVVLIAMATPEDMQVCFLPAHMLAGQAAYLRPAIDEGRQQPGQVN